MPTLRFSRCYQLPLVGLLCALLLLTGNSWAMINASLDRQQISWGDTLTLTLEATGGDSIGQPDLSPLNSDFRVLGQSSSRSYQLINGSASSSKTLAIRLRPKHTGKLSIPALTTAAGNTSPLTVTVTSNSQHSAAAGKADLFVNASIADDEVYVGQQTTLSATLYYDLDLNGGSLHNPDTDDAVIAPLGKAQQFASNINGRHYRAYKQDFSVIPTKPGQLTIAGLIFDGKKVTTGQRNIFGMTMNGFSSSEPISAASDPVTIKVLPIPADWQGVWLPAKKLTLTLTGITDQTKATVGEPLNLTLSIAAIGLSASSLPNLSLSPIDGLSIYPDKTEKQDSQVGSLIKGTKSRHFAVIPERDGQFTLPATTLSWFNTQTRQKETAKIPALTINASGQVAASANNSQSQQSTAVTTKPPKPATDVTDTSALSASVSGEHQSSSTNVWRLAFFASLLLWLLVLLVLWWRSSKNSQSAGSTVAANKTSSLHAKREFLHKLKQQDQDLLTDLLRWAQQDNANIISLAQLKRLLVAPQKQAIDALEQWRYDTNSTFPEFTLEQFSQGLEWIEKTADSSPIAPLYPSEPPKS